MSKQLNDTLIKDDNSLFELINQLTEELPPHEMTVAENASPASGKIELPFSILNPQSKNKSI